MLAPCGQHTNEVICPYPLACPCLEKAKHELCEKAGEISGVERGLDLTLLLSASPEQKQKVIDLESHLKSHFVELRKLIDSRARSVRVLALSKQTEATMETFYQFVIQLLILLVSCQIMIGGGGDASGDCKFENLVQV